MDQRTIQTIGPVRGPPGTQAPPAVPPPTGISALYGAPPVHDAASVSEETVGFSFVALPHSHAPGFAARADQLLMPLDILFGTRANASDPRVGVFELSHLNILLKNRYKEWLLFQDKKIGDILTDHLQDFDSLQNGDAERDRALYQTWADKTFRELIRMASPYPLLPFGSEYPLGLPSDDAMHLITAGPDYMGRAEKNKYLLSSLPNVAIKEVPELIGSASRNLIRALEVGFSSMAAGNSPLAPDVIRASRDIYEMLTDKVHISHAARQLVTRIIAARADITTYLSAGGIKAKFNYLGIMSSSQEDTDLAAKMDRGNLRNPYVLVRGPAEVFNRWGAAMPKGARLWLILKRIRYDNGSFGAFYYMPYWSATQTTSAKYGESKPIGPIQSKATRTPFVPSSELSYRDLSGRDAQGELILVGTLQYPVQEQIMYDAKGIASGISIQSDNSNQLDISIQQAYDAKAKLSKIDVHLGVP